MSTLWWLLTLPFKLVLWLISLPFQIALIPFKILAGLLAFVLNLAVLAVSVGFCLWVARQARLNPVLCALLGLWFPFGPLLVLGMAWFRSQRAC